LADGKLTALAVRKLTKPGFYPDGAGLYLLIDGKSRSWVFRYRRHGKEHRMGLGPERDVPLIKAREAALKARLQLREHIDPIADKRALAAAAVRRAAVEAAPVNTFDSVADLYIEAHRAGWKNAKHGAQWKATLDAYASPFFGNKSVATITVDDVLDALTPIWDSKSETASRLRSRIENILDYARTRGWRQGENPARWKANMDHLLPARSSVASVKHHSALPWADLPAAIARLEASTATSALCLRFIILTAARSGEARGARWSEIDRRKGVWTVPAEKMKAKAEHRVPLTGAAMDILKMVLPLKAHDDGLVFPGGRASRPLSEVAVSKALATVADNFTVHGMRSSFRDWCAEQTSYPRETAEAALAHTNRDRVEAAYRRSTLFEQRSKLMQDWAIFCTSRSAKADQTNSALESA
jgi:integrase